MNLEMRRSRCVKKSPQGFFEEGGILLLRPDAARNDYQIFPLQVNRLGDKDVPDGEINGDHLLRQVRLDPCASEIRAADLQALPIQS